MPPATAATLRRRSRSSHDSDILLLLLLPSVVADVPVRGCHCHCHARRIVAAGGAAGGARGWWHGWGGASILPGATGHHRLIPRTPNDCDFSGIWVTGGGAGMPRRCQKICLEQPPYVDWFDHDHGRRCLDSVTTFTVRKQTHHNNVYSQQ